MQNFGETLMKPNFTIQDNYYEAPANLILLSQDGCRETPPPQDDCHKAYETPSLLHFPTKGQ